MKASVQFPLQVSPAQAESLSALQGLFAEACNHLAPLVRSSRCWNRVALHHLAYKDLRERFPQLGSQMACNVIYSVCRSARIVYQHPQSPWNVNKKDPAGLPLLRFLAGSPVYFDRHTLSIKDDRLSLFTLDGRMHFRLDLSPEVLARFSQARLREIALLRSGESYVLHFQFGGDNQEVVSDPSVWEELPEYLIVQDNDAASQSTPASPNRAMPRITERLIA
jgi:hypothetical protein